MESDALSAPKGLSLASRSGDTREIPPSESVTSPGSYELHEFAPDPAGVTPGPSTSNGIATRSTLLSSSNSPDDSCAIAVSPPQTPSPSDPDDMSRAPLLVRSSPAQGTGSYGGLPILSVSSSPDDSDHQVTGFLQPPNTKKKGKGKQKGKSKLRHSETLRSSETLRQTSPVNTRFADSSRSEPISVSSHPRRRSTARDESSDDDLPALDEPLLQPRFSASALNPSVATARRPFQTERSSSSSSHADGLDDDDDDASASDDSLHDAKSNGQPSDNSPYSQVRASVAPTDDTSLSINTPRMWFLSMFFAILGSSTNLFFSLRYPSVSITPIIALLLVHPLGLAWDQIFKRSTDAEETFVNGSLQSRGRPTSRHSIRAMQSQPSRITRLRLWLGKGRWNAKEHCCVYISSNVSFGFAFATDVSTAYALACK